LRNGAGRFYSGLAIMPQAIRRSTGAAGDGVNDNCGSAIAEDGVIVHKSL
jgi:hypothetical protein